MSQREDCLKFETGRIKALQEERLHIQKKTFTKWMNSFLNKARMDVEDLFIDLADGKKLLKLLEIISGEKLGKPNNGKMRVHKIENVNKSLAFLHTKVRLESIGAEDIVDGNPRLILGLIWTIILRFQIQEIEIDVDEENESSEKKSAKDALLLWCQRKTNGYNYVNIQDFTGSWRSGLGFNALIHAHRPDLIDYDALRKDNHLDNLNNAFDVAERDLGIPRLLDAEDIDTTRPDEKSVLTYVASYYHTFARMKNEMKGGRRIANIVGQIMEADKMKMKYENITTTLLEWIRMTIAKLNDREFPNSLDNIQKELLKFKDYRTIEKPPKYKEKSEIEVCYFNINTRLKELKQPLYVPPDGQLVHDVLKAWDALEKAEHQRELALREELIRQTHLEQLALRFEKKSILREGYLKDMIHVLSDPRYGSNLVQVEATLKKHEAISADILAREERCGQLTTMADYLVKEQYHGQDRIKKRADEIMNTWKKLLDLLDSHKINLGNFNNLMSMLREVDTISTTMKDLDENFQSNDVGLHLLAVEDLLQKHSLFESEIAAMAETIKRLNRNGQQYITSGLREHSVLQNRLEKLGVEHAKLLQQSKERRSKLEDSRSFFQFVEDHEEENLLLSIIGERLNADLPILKCSHNFLSILKKKHKAVLDEMKARQPKSNKVIETGQELISSNHPESSDIKVRIESLQRHWNLLRELAAVKEKKLKDAAETYHFYSDANECDSWITEKRALVSSTDYGEDEPSAQALLQRHKDLEGEITAYSVDIKALNGQAEKLIKAGISNMEVQEPEVKEAEDDWVQEQKLVPQEFWEEEPIERTEYKTVTESRAVPQVKANYAFTGQDIEMAKGEVMFLLNQTNEDWWNVRKANGTDGFVPKNYVQVIEPKVVQVQVRKPEVVREIRRVKKTKMVLQNVMVKKSKNPRPTPRGTKRAEDNEPVEKRLGRVNTGYQDIILLAKKRHAYLEDAIRLFGFYRECDGFEKWIREKEKLLHADDKNETVESAKRKFEKFLTDLSASTRRVETINNMVEEFEATEHSQIDKVRMRQRQVQMLWDHLNQMKAMKERSLEGASSVELFNRTSDECRDWIIEKMTQIDTDDIVKDLKTVEALQRRHQNLERELSPIEEKVSRVMHLADSVKAAYPNEKKNVTNRQTEIQNLWEELKKKAIDRRARLEEAVGQQIFMNSSKNLLSWVSDTKDALNANETARDVSTAEALLKKHQDLGDDMRAHEDEFEEVVALGSSLVVRNPQATEVTERLIQLREERNALHRGWQEKGDWLQQAMDLQMFNREADHIDTATSGHHAFLDFDALGSSLDEVEGLMKRHQDFENTLVAQDERLKLFSEMANKLTDARHYDSQNINDRRNQVLEKRQKVKDRAKERKQNLSMSLKYHEFKTDVDDLKTWIADKTETASDESYKDLTNLERKVQKHEAFEAELRANEVRLKSINRLGSKLVKENQLRKNDVEKMLKELNEAWEHLRQLSEEKSHKLRQAETQHSYNKNLEDVRLKLEEMENQLKSNEMGPDRRACREMLKKHQNLESDISQWDQKLNELAKLGDEMQQEGHFGANNVKKNIKECQDRLNLLKQPAAARRAALEELIRFYDFLYEVEAEKQWIKEHKVTASSDTLPQDLHQAQTLCKKHKKLEAEITGHQPMINKTLENGHLLAQMHPEEETIKAQCAVLKDAWSDLQDTAEKRAQRLDLAAKAQQFFYDASEIETWMNEKNNILLSKDYGKDKDASVKLLTKHKTLELEMDSYSGLVNEMGNMAQVMVKAKHPDSKIIENKQETIVQQMKSLQKLANLRRMKLMESINRHEYFWESEDFEKFVDDQLQTAMSEDYGHDYEHLLMLQSKFDDFKMRVENCSERFKNINELAKKLIQSGSAYANDIDVKEDELHDDIPRLVSQKHEIICNKWNNLLAHIQARDQKLQAAAEIHRFNRDAADALARIQEKVTSIPDGVGRDVNSCESMLRIHDQFEIDLLALEAQLQVLVDDAARLQSLYPTNAENIREEQNLVIEAWNDLQTRASQKKEELQAAADFHRFSSAVRDLMNWSSSLQSTMLAQEKVRDTASAQILMTEHDRLKGEIGGRQEKFQNVFNLGQCMIQDEHSASEEVKQKLDILSREKERLQLAWEKKKIYLDQLIDLQIFLRDAKQLDTLCSSQEVTLSSTDFTDATVEEVDAQLKKHEAFEKLLQTQEEKFNLLQDQGGKLVAQNHFESPTVKTRMEEVSQHRLRVKALCKKRRARLEDALLYVQFLRDTSEAGSWIDEKKKKLEFEVSQSSVTTLEEKIKKLKKHQAFEAELSANEPRIHQIMDKGQKLIDKKHDKSKDIQKQLELLEQAWKALLMESKNCGKGLEEAQDILDFNNQVEKVEAWIREKELLVVASDIGRDYEHCGEIQRKLDDVNSDMKVDDSRIKNINQLAEKLLSQSKKDKENKPIEERKNRLNSKWKDLKGALANYREKLAGAMEVHAFNRDVDDTQARINEKMLTMSVDDVGRDLDSVEMLIRKQDALERDMSAIGQKLSDLTTEHGSLVKKYPDMTESITEKLRGVQESWDELSTACINRRTALTDSSAFQKFMKDLRELEIWVEDMVTKLNTGELPNSSVEVEAQVQLYQERKADILGRQDHFEILRKFGHRLVTEGHSATIELKNGIDQIDEMKSKLNSSCKEREIKLKQAQQLQQFNKMAEEANSLLADKEAFLNNDDLGDSLSSVENLIRKHDAFEKTLGVQLKRVDELQKFGELIRTDHYSAPTINRKLRDLQARQDKLEKAASARKSKLNDSKAYNRFLRNVHEVEGWILEKMQIATDECYREITNLQSKIQKHQAFESELLANESRVSSIWQEGESLLVADDTEHQHFAANEISNRLDELKNLWKQLQDASTLRKDRLQEAYQALLFNQNLDDLDIWMEELEQQLESEDHGKDLTTVQHLIKKWQQLNAEFTNHSEQIEQIKQSADAFEKSNHFLKDDIKERVSGLLKRYQALQEPLHIRKDNLEDALKLYQFLRDLEDELQWIHEKEPTATSTDLGTSLIGVQSLQKKHQALEAEIQTHDPFVTSLVTRGQQMVRSKHFASEQISSKIEQVQNKLSALKDAASIRKLRLIDAVLSQAFLTEASEAEAWMKDKKPYLASVDYGKDEDSVENLMKKLTVNQRDLSNFGVTISKLVKTSQELIERNHFDSENITKTISKIQESYSELQKLGDKRSQRLIDAQKLFKFLRDGDEVGEWIQEQMNIAGSEDYGRDVEHVEILIQKFEAFMVTVNHAGESRITAVQHSADHLIEEGHPEPDKINGKAKEVKHLWEEFKELANARQDALHGAKQVHMFDRTADETIGWISEKDAAISSEDYGHDLESIQTLVRKQQAFERDLAAVKEQVEAVLAEARRLADIFPDAREHIMWQYQETVEAWNSLLEKSAHRKDRLNQAEQLQAYFDTYRELLAWINETLAKVTAPELAKDVPGAEALIARHKEYKAEISSKSGSFEDFILQGRQLIKDGHFLADEIEDKVTLLKQRWQYLQDIWTSRITIYEQNLDSRKFLRDAQQLESWLASRETILKDDSLGDTIAEAEDLLKRHEGFQKTIDAQADNLESLTRKTLIEEAFLAQLKKEEEAKKEEAKRAERERTEAIKRKEVQRITDERKREDERRRTQEVKFNRDDMNGDSSHSGDKLDDNGRYAGDEASHWKQSSGVGNSFVDRLRRGSDPGLVLAPLLVVEKVSDGEVKRSESFKVDSKKPKRTPSFTTRRRTQSFRKLKKLDNPENLPPLEISGYLERKHELQSGGKRAAVRSWKTYYVVLCGQLLCFFKDENDFAASKANSSPIMIYQATCEKASDYTKRKHVFRLKTSDGSEYLFLAESDAELQEWLTKITFHAQLPPSQQLTSYETYTNQEGGFGSGGSSQDLQPMQDPAEGHHRGSVSSTKTRASSNSSNLSRSYGGGRENDGDRSSSSNSTPDTPRRTAFNQPRSREPVYANMPVFDVLQGQGDEAAHSTQSPNTNGHGKNFQNGNGSGTADEIDGWNKRHSFERGGPPPLPVVNPPAHLLGMRHAALYNNSRINDPYRQVYTAGSPSNPSSRHDLQPNKRTSLPAGTMPPPSAGSLADRRQLSATLEHRRRNSESSSESDSPASNQRAKDEKRKSSGLLGLFRKKKATQL